MTIHQKKKIRKLKMFTLQINIFFYLQSVKQIQMIMIHLRRYNILMQLSLRSIIRRIPVNKLEFFNYVL
jgi:hypothetical protein